LSKAGDSLSDIYSFKIDQRVNGIDASGSFDVSAVADEARDLTINDIVEFEEAFLRQICNDRWLLL
jgi:hypothetical protein